MKEQLIVIGVIAIIVTVGLSGCSEVSDTVHPEKTRFVGTWQNTTRNSTKTFMLFSDGSCSFSNLTGKWNVTDGMFVMEFPDSHLFYQFYYTFSNNDGSLSLTSAVTMSTTSVFTKQ